MMVLFLLVLALGSCDLHSDEQDDPGGDSGGNSAGDTPSFEPFVPPSIIVDNQRAERLVAFKGSLNPKYLISGIPAYATNHGLKKDPVLFNATDSFILLLITEEQYNANKNNLGVLENATCAKIFAFYNNSGTNNNHFEISSKIGGNGRLTISNPTQFNVEIRSGGPTGEILGYAPAQMTLGTVLYLNIPNNYDIYPVFKFFNPNDGELYSVIPKFSEGEMAGKPYVKPITLINTANFNLNEVYDQSAFNLSSGGVYIRVTNNANAAIRFFQGDTERNTSTGISGIGPANSNVFTIQISRNPDGTYPESQNIAQLKFESGGRTLTIPAQEYKLDYLYEIEVTGTNVSTMELKDMTEKNKVDLDKMFGL
jgi:hypothetical protein